MAEPTMKSVKVENFLSGLAGSSRSDAIKNDRCLFCKQPAVRFTDEISRREFAISGMCQVCQDGFFTGEGE